MAESELEKAFARRRSAPPVQTPAKNEPPAKNELPETLQKAIGNLGDPMAPSAAPSLPDVSDGGGASFDSPAAAFDRIVASQEIAETQAAYTAMIKALGHDKPPTIKKLAEGLLPQLGHRSKQFLNTLSARAASVTAVAKQPKRRAVVAVAIVGAGPVGLRTAIELALLGARVEVLEQRAGFSRLQVLHLWDWVEADLIELGIKFIDPSVFATTDVRRCTTMQLQASLHKVALLCGCRVRFGCKVEAQSIGKTFLKRVDVLVDASGARCPLLENLGFGQEVALKSQRALCIVISLVNGKTPEEQQLRESTWASQFYQAEFAALAKDHGVGLENLVYYRSTGAFATSATHYFVMTTSAEALHSYGVLKAPAGEVAADALCAAANVDAAKLEAYARAAVGAFVPSLASHAMCDGQLSLFDFSERKQSNKASALVQGAAVGSKQDTPCIVTRVGDALQEPFWPEGLGINRGFLGCFDCADLVLRAAPLLITELGKPPSKLEDFAPLLQRREAIFALTKRISGTNRQKELKPHSDGSKKFTYTLEPGSRYVSWSEANGGRDGAGGGWLGRGGGAKAAPPAASGPPRMKWHVAPVASVR